MPSIRKGPFYVKGPLVSCRRNCISIGKGRARQPAYEHIMPLLGGDSPRKKRAALAAPFSLCRRSCLFHDQVGPHHLIVFVVKDMTVPDIARALGRIERVEVKARMRPMYRRARRRPAHQEPQHFAGI